MFLSKMEVCVKCTTHHSNEIANGRGTISAGQGMCSEQQGHRTKVRSRKSPAGTDAYTVAFPAWED